jgi:hypothetical protein
MLEDAIANAVLAIDEYLNNPIYDDMNNGRERRGIVRLRDFKDSVRASLETVLPERPQGAPRCEPQLTPRARRCRLLWGQQAGSLRP